MKQTFTVFTVSGMIAFIHSTPSEIKTLAFISLILAFTDMMVGVITAIVCKEFRSSTMRVKWVLKMTMYFGMYVISNALTIVSGYWEPVAGTAIAISAIEVGSLLEKFVKMKVVGEINLGPFDGWIGMIAPHFGVSINSNFSTPGQTVMRHTAVISNNPNEPEIHMTEVESTTLHKPKETKANEIQNP